MTQKLDRLILHTSSIVGAYLSIVLFLILGSDITDVIPENFIFVLALLLIITICWVYYRIGWTEGIGFVIIAWLLILLFDIFFIQIPLSTPGSLPISNLPYTNIRSLHDSRFVESDYIVSSSSPEVDRVRQRSITHPEDRTDPYIERYFLSWRYGILLKKTQRLGDKQTTYRLYPSSFLENLSYSIRTVSETVFRFLVFTYLPFILLVYYLERRDKELTDKKIIRFTNNNYLRVVIYFLTIGLITVGGLSILFSYP